MPKKHIFGPTQATVASLMAAVEKLPRKAGTILMYRGVKRTTWENEAAIFRPDTDLLSWERDIVRELPSIHPAEFENDKSMFDRLVRMQHYGLPTRLLDVTSSPLVAAYFASESSDDNDEDGYITAFHIPPDRQKYYDSDAVSCIANLSNMSDDEKIDLAAHTSLSVTKFNQLDSVDRLTQFVRAEKPYFRPKINPIDLRRPFYVKPKMSNRRIIAQYGSFIIYGLNIQSDVKPYKTNIRVSHWVVPKSSKVAIRNSLADLGINVSALFPEIDKAASYVSERYAASKL